MKKIWTRYDEIIIHVQLNNVFIIDYLHFSLTFLYFPRRCKWLVPHFSNRWSVRRRSAIICLVVATCALQMLNSATRVNPAEGSMTGFHRNANLSGGENTLDHKIGQSKHRQFTSDGENGSLEINGSSIAMQSVTDSHTNKTARKFLVQDDSDSQAILSLLKKVQVKTIVKRVKKIRNIKLTDQKQRDPAPFLGRQKEQHRRSSCDRCFVRNFTYIHRPNDICGLNSSADTPALDLVMAVITSPYHTRARMFLRTTWLSATNKNQAPNVRYVFLLGATDNRRLQQRIDNEFFWFKDVVQMSFRDAYRNLTYKTMMMLEWALADCYNARYILKVDDDVFVNVNNVLRVIEKFPVPGALIGEVPADRRPLRGHTKWRVSYEEYSLPRYPPLVLGPRYLVPMAIVSDLLRASLDTPYFRLEDVYMGLLIQKTNYTVQASMDLLRGGKLSPDNCTRTRETTTIHGIEWNLDILLLWEQCFQGGLWISTLGSCITK